MNTKNYKNDVTYAQFCNILTFITLFLNNYSILDQSPDYILEKYKRYIGDPSLVPKTPEGGIHEILQNKLIKPYLEKWNNVLEIIKVVDS